MWCDILYDVMWYDVINDVMWYDMVWCDIILYDVTWYDMCDVIWCDVIWYMMWCDMIYDVMWYDIWCDMMWYMIWCDIIWYDVMWCDMLVWEHSLCWGLWNYKRCIVWENSFYYLNESKNAYNVEPADVRFGKLSVREDKVVLHCALYCPSAVYSSRWAVLRDTHHYRLGYTRSLTLFVGLKIVQLVLQSNTGLHKLISVYGNMSRRAFVSLYSRTQRFKTSKDSCSKNAKPRHDDVHQCLYCYSCYTGEYRLLNIVH